MSSRRALDAYALDDGPPARVHGYALREDLALHYRFTDLVLLSLTGSIPSDESSAVFEVAMMFAAEISVSQAPVHAALLARRYGSRDAGVFTVAACGTAEQVRHEQSALGELLSWFDEPNTDPPGCFAATGTGHNASLRAALVGRNADVPHLDRLDPMGAVHACFWSAGLTEPWQLASAWSLARMPLVLAEAFAHRPGDLADYPIDVPPFRAPEVR
jgi:hypothetical protein